MDRQTKIKLLERLLAGEQINIGRVIPRVYCDKFKRKSDLIADLKQLFGPDAKIVQDKSGIVKVISDVMVMWQFYEQEPGVINHGNIVFTQAEYDLFLAEIGKDGNWHELKSYPPVLHWVADPRNEPLTEHPDFPDVVASAAYFESQQPRTNKSTEPVTVELKPVTEPGGPVHDAEAEDQPQVQQTGSRLWVAF